MKPIQFLLKNIIKFFNFFYSYYESLYSVCKRQFVSSKDTWIGTDCDLLGGGFFELGSNVVIKKHSVLHAYREWKSQVFSPTIKIGNNCFLGEYIHISCINRIEIGNYCLFGRRVTITDHSHGTALDLETPPLQRDLFSKGPVIIGDNCWVGENVCILPNVKIGKNVIIGAGSIVTHDIPDNSIAVGAPARITNVVK